MNNVEKKIKEVISSVFEIDIHLIDDGINSNSVSNWDSLRQAYLDSADVLEHDPVRYTEMSAGAQSSVYRHYSEEKVAQALQGFLARTARQKKR